MAHIAKYKAPSVGHMLAHYRRDRSSLERDNIDPERIKNDLVVGHYTNKDGKLVVGRVEPREGEPNWRKALSRLVDNPIAHAALAVRQNVARWVEKDARAADRVIKREVKSVRKELGSLVQMAEQARQASAQLESERASGRPESRSRGVDR